MNMFFKFMPNAMKDIDLILIGTGPEVKFKTYGQETIINIDKKALKSFTAKSFDSYFELFKAANLINKIKDITKGKVAVKQDPFYILPSVGSIIG